MSTVPVVPRVRARRPLAGLLGAALVALALPLGATLPASGTGVAPAPVPVAPKKVVAPVTPAFGPGIEAGIDYEAQAACSPVAKPGAVKLAALLVRTYGKADIGITRPCSDGGLSEHKEGRALDWMRSLKVPAQRAQVNSFLAWLLAPDANGNPAAMAKRLGVMYLGWNNHIWRGYDPARGWADLKGCSVTKKMAAAGYDTYCHRNHLHISLTWEGAMAMTSFWTGTPLAAPCTTGWSWGQPAPVAAVDLTPVTPVRVVDTRVGTGLATGPCRLAQPRWGGDRRDLVVPVVGKGEVPATAVASVAVRVTVSRATGLLPTVSVRSTSSSALVPVVSPSSSGEFSSTAVVPVASDGTIRLAIDRGSADVAVDVLAWAPPAVPVAVPPTGAPTTPTPPAVPPAAAGSVGTLHVVGPVLGYLGAPLAAGEVRTVSLVGRGGVPATGLNGLIVTLTAAPTVGGSDWVGVSAAPTGATVASLRTSLRAGTAAQAVVPTKDGQVTLRNTGRVPVTVALTLLGWNGSAPATGGARLTLLAAPTLAVDSARKIGLVGPATTPKARAVVLGAPAGVPAGAQAALVQVSAYGGTTEGGLVLASRGADQALGLVPARWSHDVMLLPLLPSGAVAFSTRSLGTQVRLRVLGYVA